MIMWMIVIMFFVVIINIVTIMRLKIISVA